MKWVFFGDVNISINGKNDILKFTFTLEIQKCNYFDVLLYLGLLFSICFLYTTPKVADNYIPLGRQ